MNEKELKQFKDGVAMGKSFGVPVPMLMGYFWGYWIDQAEKAMEQWLP